MARERRSRSELSEQQPPVLESPVIDGSVRANPSSSVDSTTTTKTRPRLRLWPSLLGIACSIAFFTALAAVGWVLWAVHKPITPGVERYDIAEGSSLSAFASELKRRGVVEETASLKLWAKAAGIDGQIKLGQYDLSEQRSIVDVLSVLVRGDVISHTVVLIEGQTTRQFRDTLAGTSGIENVTRDLSDSELLELLGATEAHAEGLFFPDTYEYVDGTTDRDILERAYRLMKEKLNEAWESRRSDAAPASAYEALILASIIEKETGDATERARISGVFTNRIEQGMRLQTDPTVIYGLGQDFDGNLTRKHLRSDTEYNTYTRAGLPPTPIANPGADALLAAVQPEETAELYFVARGDGSHQFSETLDEHNAAVDRYQRRRKQN